MSQLANGDCIYIGRGQVGVITSGMYYHQNLEKILLFAELM